MLCWLWLAALFHGDGLPILPALPVTPLISPPRALPHPCEQEELKAYMASRGKKVGEGEKLDAKAINKVRQLSQSPF